MTKTIFVVGQTKEQAAKYIRAHVKIVTDEQQLEGYDSNNVIIILPSMHIKSVAKTRNFEIIEV